MSDPKHEMYVNMLILACLCVCAVSMMAAQEYEGMKEQLDLEQSLRVKAETYAHEVKTQKHSITSSSCLFPSDQ